MFEEIKKYVFTVLISIKKQNFGRNDRSLVSSLLPNEPKKVERIRARNAEEPDESTVRSHNARILILRVSTFRSFSLFSFFLFFPTAPFTQPTKRRETEHARELLAKIQDRLEQWSTGCTFGVSIAVPLWSVHMQLQPWHQESGHCPTLRLSEQ